MIMLAWAVLAAGQAEAWRTLDDFDRGAGPWGFVGGQEFPGAKGSMEVGDGALRLRADFSGGGAYVGLWRRFDDPVGLAKIRLRVRAEHVTRLGVRLADATDQCHQSAVVLLPTGDWQEVILDPATLVGGEHWGGADDGKWHGTLKGLGLNVGKDDGPATKSLWIDRVEIAGAPPVTARPTALPARVNPPICRPGFGTRITYRWDAEPMGRDVGVFVHFVNGEGHMVFQADHGPGTATSGWNGRVEYTKTIYVHDHIPPGDYRIMVGLYDRDGRYRLRPGAGVADPGQAESDRRVQVGVLRIDPAAPVPPLPAPTLDLTGYEVTFNEEFDGPLDVSRAGPGTRWIAHTPYWGDFGDAGFADPADGFPFRTENGILKIEARKTPQGWRSGLLSSVDPQGRGFSQQYGYFEMRAKFPKSPGMWPAFWIMGVRGISDKSRPNPEIDVVEQYGAMENALTMAYHSWGPGKKHEGRGETAIVTGMAEDFHRYGVRVDERHIVWYFDGVEIHRIPTPQEAKTPLYIMVNLAMGGGWPIDKAVSGSIMEVDYVKAWARR